MNLKTRYLGLELEHPLVASSGPLTQDVGHMRSLEDAGASAVVMPSLMEEQILLEAEALHHHRTHPASLPGALSYLPDHVDYHAIPDHYLEIIRRAKEAVGIPVIASLNAYSTGSWCNYARKIEEAGADALELNIYFVPADLNQTGAEIEQIYLDIVRQVRGTVSIPLAVKVGPYFSSMGNMAVRLVKAGANGLVLFNRFYQPDIDLTNFEVTPNLRLSTSFTSRLSVRWIAILYGRIEASLAGTGGVHDHEDVLKLLMVGADVTMMTSALLLKGIYHIGEVRKDLARWMEEHEYESVEQMKGSMSARSYEDPSAFERANYMQVLESYKGIHAYRAG